MNKRLETIARFIKSGGVIDVGTDHGYLPVELALRGYAGRILASDINSAPLALAERNAEAAGVSDKIEFLLCDGLEGCDGRGLDTIVIAGMGGDTICGILDRAEWYMDRRYTLVFQPMTKAEILRYWLVNNEFEIEAEALVSDAGTLYQVFTARFGGKTSLSDAELFTGSFPMIRTDPLFPRLLRRLTGRFEKAVGSMEDSSAGTLHPGREALMRGILAELEEMNENGDS